MEHGVGHPEERGYVLRVVLKEFLGLEYRTRLCDRAATHLSLEGVEQPRGIDIEDSLFPTGDDEWLSRDSLPLEPLESWSPPPWIRTAALGRQAIPVLLGRRVALGDYCLEDCHGIRLGLDIFGSVFFMLSRYEEAVAPSVRDDHDRFPASASVAFREGFLDRPIVDEYVDVLWACMKRLWPDLRRRSRQYKMMPTHDVDVVSTVIGRPWSKVGRSAMGDIIRRRSPAGACGRLLTRARNSYDDDPLNTFDFLMEQSESHDLVSEFYFMTGDGKCGPDGTYSIDAPFVQRLMKRIHDRGHLIGLHASYGTFRTAKAIRGEFDHLLRVAEKLRIDQPRWGGRQHYLRFGVPETWASWDEAGLDYDSTLSYADHVGFRCGTCHEFPVFDLRRRTQLRLTERPLIAMDGSLLDERYMGLGLHEVPVVLTNLATQCRAANGNLVVLWHNSSLYSEDMHSMYTWLVEGLSPVAPDFG